MEEIAVSKFREYLRIKTVQPNPDYKSCTAFLLSYAKEIGIQKTRLVEPVPGKDLVILTIEGTDPSLKSLILNSHTDVVPVSGEFWRHDPFEAFKDPADGKIYARGSQDMKCVGIWYMEALRLILKRGLKMKRTVHLTFVPDEEV
jgi:aminoacylase